MNIFVLLREYGLGYLAARALYAGKIKLLHAVPKAAVLFERKAEAVRTDVLSVDTASLKIFLSTLDKTEQEHVVKIAQNAAYGRIPAFSAHCFDYGNPIDWQRNPVTGKSADKTEPWYKIPDFDTERGDIKYIWEASRFGHFIYFARAYLITGDGAYYQAFSEQLHDWLEKNPYPYGANYKCGQECALRMMNALLAFHVFKREGSASPADATNIRILIERCYKKIRSNFFYAHRCIRNNHTLSELTGMIIGAWCCNQPRVLQWAYRLLEKEIYRQFFEDGGYIQYSFNYTRLALQLMELLKALKTGVELSDIAVKRIVNTAKLLLQMQQKDGKLPNYGPNDGALIFPLTVCNYQDYRPCLNAVLALYGQGAAYPPGKYDEELYWFGASGVKRKLYLPRSSAFQKAGLYSLRRGDLFVMTVCQEYVSRPAHFDQLHIDVWYRGNEVFCDSGTYSYASDEGLLLASTKAHNTIMADGREQMDRRGAFFTYNWTTRTRQCYNDGGFEGEISSCNGYVHRREIALYEHHLAITDEVSNANNVRQIFHTPCDVALQEGGVALYKNGRIVCTLYCEGEIQVQKSERSLYYMQKGELCEIIITALEMPQTIHVYFVEDFSI